MRIERYIPLTEDIVREAAQQAGPQNPAISALEKAKKLRQEGNTVSFFKVGRRIVVRSVSKRDCLRSSDY